MAHSKNKKPKAIFNPKSREIITQYDPNEYYSQKPAWNFHSRDNKMWCFSEDTLGNTFWNEILLKLCNWETMTWSSILNTGKNNNHSIIPEDLNKIAQNRLVELNIEAEGIVSLRLTGTHRLYGYMDGRVYNILWYDSNHGDNDSCVCRSHKKHT